MSNVASKNPSRFGRKKVVEGLRQKRENKMFLIAKNGDSKRSKRMKKCLIPANNRKNLKKSFLLGAFGIIWGPVQAQHNAVELRAVHNQRIRRQGLKPQQCKKSLNFRSFQVNVIAVSTEATFRLPAVQSN